MKSFRSFRLLFAGLLGAALVSTLHASTTPARPLSQKAPHYAFELRKDEFEGAVVVGLSVSTSGQVMDARILSSTNRVFEKPVLDAAQKWKFQPAMKDGVAVNSTVEQLVTFTVPGKTPATSIDSLVDALEPLGDCGLGNEVNAENALVVLAQ
ncbi:MAG: energy transducer TonB [Opitutaceae bacterium]|nr:energy transducer TonB [Opitutaceae bacterium]